MMIGSLFLGPIYALFTPVTLLYPVFIVLSALRLNARVVRVHRRRGGDRFDTGVIFRRQTSNATVSQFLPACLIT
jgi:hypothetical protein